MYKIKKIDLINRIASGTAPERFICNDCLWCKGKSDKEHYYGENGKYQLNFIRLDELNDEVELFDEQVEIIEEDKEENEIPNINLDNMKDIGTKVGKAYRELFEGLNKGWNTPLEEDKKIKKIKYYDDSIAWVIDGAGQLSDIDKIAIDKINELIDKVNSIEKS